MDREKAREQLATITEDAARQAETFRIEADYHLRLAISNSYVAKHGKIPEKEVLNRLVSSFQTTFYES